MSLERAVRRGGGTDDEGSASLGVADWDVAGRPGIMRGGEAD